MRDRKLAALYDFQERESALMEQLEDMQRQLSDQAAAHRMELARVERERTIEIEKCEEGRVPRAGVYLMISDRIYIYVYVCMCVCMCGGRLDSFSSIVEIQFSYGHIPIDSCVLFRYMY